VSWWLRPHVITELGDITGLSNPRQLMRISAWSRRRTRAGAHAARAALLRVPTQSSRASCERSAATRRVQTARAAPRRCAVNRSVRDLDGSGLEVRFHRRPRKCMQPRMQHHLPTARVMVQDQRPGVVEQKPRGFVAEGAEGAFQPSNQLPCRSWPCAWHVQPAGVAEGRDEEEEEEKTLIPTPLIATRRSQQPIATARAGGSQTAASHASPQPVVNAGLNLPTNVE
jgi:hypothetical protein